MFLRLRDERLAAYGLHAGSYLSLEPLPGLGWPDEEERELQADDSAEFWYVVPTGAHVVVAVLRQQVVVGKVTGVFAQPGHRVGHAVSSQMSDMAVPALRPRRA